MSMLTKVLVTTLLDCFVSMVLLNSRLPFGSA